VHASWTLSELVAQVATRIAALPAPKNGQVRAVPDDRTIRYYVTLGLLDRPCAMRGRTALYDQKHVAQVVAIKRLQAMGRSLSEIQALWPTLDDPTLARMSGVELPLAVKPAARAAFWKREPVPREGPEPGAGDPAREPGSPDGLVAAETPAPARPAALPRAWIVTRGGSSVADRPGAPGATPEAMPARPSPAVAGHAAGVAPPPAAAVELRIELAPQVVLSLSITDESVVISPADVRALRVAAAPLLAELASRRLASHAEGEDA
jgi:hypothetical protein